jgi:membrane-associated protease RseP (regulator of RpoE activity)
MRRIPALLLAAGLAAAPTSVVAGPSHDPDSTAQTVEKFEWSTSRGRLGVMVMGLTPELRTHFGAPADRGVLVAHVEPGTPAASAGVQVADVIVEVKDKKIDSAADVLAALENVHKGEHAKIELVRDGKTRTLDATLTNDAVMSDMAFPPWVREWMKPFDSDRSPFDGPSFFHDGQAGASTSANGPAWFEKLREMFTTPKH